MHLFSYIGSIPLSPLSYITMTSNVFNWTHSSSEGCYISASIGKQVTIKCRQGTILIDCKQGNNFSDLSNYFIWNRTTSVAEPVSIVFRFRQQINISRISMFFWNSPSNSIIVPNMMMYWSNDDPFMPSNVINITSSTPNRTGQQRVSIDNSNDRPQFQYLRIVMSFYNNSEWIFLGEVQFCGEWSHTS